VIDKFPIDVRRKIGIYSGYSNAMYFANVQIEEGKLEVVITDFGITFI
jgi:hypothetical protein